MKKNIDIKELPSVLPIFPLPGAIVLPNGSLPLNIFEPRYISMVENVLGTHRIIGMIQPISDIGNEQKLYPIGCAAKIVAFSETSDNRYLIELKGIIRFQVIKELRGINGYRNVQPNWQKFKEDLTFDFKNININNLLEQLKVYFINNNINVDFSELSKIPSEQIISAIPQICTFKTNEKQAILEAKNTSERVDVLISLLKMNLLEENENSDETIN